MTVATPEEHSDRTSRLYRAHGMVPSSDRVWRGGRDVTHEPPSTWGFPYSLYVSGARGAALQADYLRWHAEAVAERDASGRA